MSPRSATPQRLPRKQAGDATQLQAQWLRVWRATQEAAADPDYRAEVRRSYVAPAAARIARWAAPDVAYGWSGGKDSIALQIAAHEAGVERGFIVLSRLEFPSFEEWVEQHAPTGLAVERREHLDLDWLTEHPQHLFPSTSGGAAQWFARVQHAGQRDYVRRTNTSVLLLGRRTADGNFTGPGLPDGSRGYTKDGVLRLSPIWDYSHEAILAMVACFGPDLPSLYTHSSRGFRVATGPWPARQVDSLAQGWREVDEIDPSIRHEAAQRGLPGSKGR